MFNSILNLPFNLISCAKNIAMGLFLALGCLALYTYGPVAQKVDSVAEKAAGVVPSSVKRSLAKGAEKVGLKEPPKSLATRVAEKAKTLPSRTLYMFTHGGELAFERILNTIFHPVVFFGCIALALLRFRGTI